MEEIKNWIIYKFAVFFGKYISLDRIFRKNKAIATIHFIEGQDPTGGSIKIKVGGMIYYFEGLPEFEKYQNATGENITKKILKYGGWEMDLMHPNNKF